MKMQLHFAVNHAADAFHQACLLYTSDAADERSSVDLGGRRIIKKKNNDTARPHHKQNILKNKRQQNSKVRHRKTIVK